MAFATINNLILTDPLGGEEWRGTQNITWTHTDNGSSGPISILLSSDGGANYNTLVTGVDVTLDTYFWDTSGTTDGSTYKIKINDLSSGIAYESDTNFIVDNTDPITGYAIAPLTPNGENGWYVGTAPVVTLTPTDNLAGIYKTYYRFDGGPYTEYSAPFSAPEGEHTLEYYSEDNAVDSTGIRNVEVTHSQVIKTDVTIPTGAMTYSKNPVKLGDVLTITADFSEPLQDSPVVNLAISGANTSGPGAMTKVTTTQYTYVYTVGAGDGTATVALSIGKDVAGNSITASPTTGGTFIVDNIAPT